LEQAAALIPDSIVVEDDHGRFQVGHHDEAASFPSRKFAQQVAAQEIVRAES
jgi:hypothetical protein